MYLLSTMYFTMFYVFPMYCIYLVLCILLFYVFPMYGIYLVQCILLCSMYFLCTVHFLCVVFPKISRCRPRTSPGLVRDCNVKTAKCARNGKFVLNIKSVIFNPLWQKSEKMIYYKSTFCFVYHIVKLASANLLENWRHELRFSGSSSTNTWATYKVFSLRIMMCDDLSFIK